MRRREGGPPPHPKLQLHTHSRPNIHKQGEIMPAPLPPPAVLLLALSFFSFFLSTSTTTAFHHHPPPSPSPSSSPSSLSLLHRCRGGGGAEDGSSSGSATTSTALYQSISISESRPGSSDEGRYVYNIDTLTGRLTDLATASPRRKAGPTAAGGIGGGDALTTTTATATASMSTTSPSAAAAAPPIFSKLKTSWASSLKKLRQLLQTVFLPVGWPASVAPEYLRYQRWNVVQDLSTYLRGILATQAILEGVGVGREGATPLAATLQWITRDGASMMSGLVFTSLLSTNFGVNAKSWRLFADFIVDVGITLDMLAPVFPEKFLLCICLASVCKSLCGISAGAANGAIVEHFAKTNNLAEVLAKGGAQHTAVSLFGLGFGMWFARVANQSPKRVWTAYVLLTVLHLISNYMAMRVLAFTSINRRRLDVLLRAFDKGSVPAPAQVARTETIILDPTRWGLLGRLLGRGGGGGGQQAGCKVRLGVRLKEVTSSASELLGLQETFQQEPYLLNVVGRSKDNSKKKKKKKAPLQILVALREDATNLTLLKAYFHAHLLQAHLRKDQEKEVGRAAEAEAAFASAPLLPLIHTTFEETCSLFPSLEQGLKNATWNLDRLLLSPEGWVFHQDKDT